MRGDPEPQPAPPEMVLDLVAAVIDAGAPPAHALRTVAACLHDAGDPMSTVLLRAGAGMTETATGSAHPAVTALAGALDLADATGLAPSALVRAAAEQERRRRVNAQALAVRRLAVFVVIPMALCLLPAFMLLTVAPVVLALLAGV